MGVIKIDKYRMLAQFFSNTTELTENQALFLAENNFQYWSDMQNQLMDIFLTIKSTKQMLIRMGIQ